MIDLSEKVPPQNIEAEKGVLGSMLADNAVISDVVQIVSPDDFYRDSHVAAALAIWDMAASGKRVDGITLSDELTRRGEFDRVGGDDFLADVLNNGAITVNATYYAGIVKDKSSHRRMIEVANQINRDSHSNNFTADQVLEMAQRNLFEVAGRQDYGKAQDAGSVAIDAMNRVKDRLNGVVDGVKTGFERVDYFTGGLLNSRLAIIASRPSQGKTSLALNMCENIAFGQSRSALFVSLEMDATELGERLLASQAMIDGTKLRLPRALSRDDWDVLEFACDRIAETRIFIDDRPSQTLGKISATARNYRLRHGISVVMIDYLSLIELQLAKGEPRHEGIARTSRALKALARELGIPVLVLHQLNRQSENREDRRPRLSDLAESGQIERDADLVMLLHRPEFYNQDERPGEADLLIAKNRCGMTGPVRLAFAKHLTRFDNLTTRYEADNDWRD